MKIRSILGALVIAAIPFTSVWAENMTPEDIQKLVDEAVTKKLQEYERREGAMEHKKALLRLPRRPRFNWTPDQPQRCAKGRGEHPSRFGSSGSGRLSMPSPLCLPPKPSSAVILTSMYNNLVSAKSGQLSRIHSTSNDLFPLSMRTSPTA